LTHYDYGFRIYNPAIARFLSVDPLAPSYPWYTPYQFAGNMPIVAVDLDGLEPKVMIDEQGKLTEPVIALMTATLGFDGDVARRSKWKDYITSFEGRAWFKLTGYPGASVKGEDVFYHGRDWGGRASSDWLGLIFHEETHRQHVDQMGNPGFYASYLAQGIVVDYRKILTEHEAYRNGADTRRGDDVVDLLLNNTDALLILEDGGLTDDQKITDLTLLGRTFRATTVLPNAISEIETNIKSFEKVISKPDGDTKFNRSMVKGLKNILKHYNAELNKINHELGVD
jgi:hypothetical protein